MQENNINRMQNAVTESIPLVECRANFEDALARMVERIESTAENYSEKTGPNDCFGKWYEAD